MIINTQRSTVSSTMAGVAKKFRIAESPEAFEILSSSLYQEPMLAIVRELLCNAIDAHTIANVERSPEITLPTKDHPTLIIEDFGAGMTQDEIDEIYTSYFTSSKSASNDQVGAFGLGAKTPFSYVNEFIVETTTSDLEKRTYLSYRDEDGYLATTLTSVEPTSHTGTRVSITVKSYDCADFANCLVRVYPFLNTQPVITNPDVVVPAVDSFCVYALRESNDLRVLQTVSNLIRDRVYLSNESSNNYERAANRIVSQYGKMVVIMGGVAYGVNPTTVWSKYDLATLNSIIFLSPSGQNRVRLCHANIGDFAIAPSRESLSFKADSATRLLEHIKAETTAYFRDFLTLKDTKDVSNWIAENDSCAIDFYDKWFNQPFPTEAPFIADIVKKVEEIDKVFAVREINVVKIQRRNTKSFSVKGISPHKAHHIQTNIIHHLNELRIGMYFVVPIDAYAEIISAGISGQVMKAGKIRSLLNYLIDKTPAFREMLNDDGGIFVSTQEEYDYINSLITLQDPFELMTIEVPRVPKAPRLPSMPKTDKVFKHSGKWMDYDELIKLAGKSKIVYDVITNHDGADKSCIIDFAKLSGSVKKEDAVKGYVWTSWHDESATMKIHQQFTFFCENLGLPKSFTPATCIVQIKYGDFKRYHIWKDSHFVNGIIYYGSQIAASIPDWQTAMEEVQDVAEFIDDNRKVVSAVMDKFKKIGFIPKPGACMFYDHAEKLLLSSPDLNGTRDRYNTLETLITDLGMPAMGVRFPKISKITFANNTGFFSQYPMLELMDCRHLSTVTSDTVDRIVAYIKTCDKL